MLKRYSQEQLAFIEKGFMVHRVPELTALFNDKFDENKTPGAIKGCITNNKFKCGRKVGLNKGESKLFSPEQIEFIKEQYKKMNATAVTTLLNREFESSFTPRQIKSYVHNHGINSGRTGHFEKGAASWNSGTKGLMKANSGSFKKGDRSLNQKPIGHERICSKDEYILIKTDQINPYTGQRGWYRAKHVVNYENEFGPVPDGFVLRFKDRNKANCDPSNLFLVSRAVSLRLSKNGYLDLPDEVKPVARTVAELEVKTFERAKA